MRRPSNAINEPNSVDSPGNGTGVMKGNAKNNKTALWPRS